MHLLMISQEAVAVMVQRQDTPLLAGIDLPTFDANNPWAETADNDDDHGKLFAASNCCDYIFS